VLAISGTFLLSQSISTLETQRDFFEKHGAADQAYYITQVQGYLKEFDGLTAGTEAYQAAADTVGAEIAADSVVSRFQLDPSYVPALKDAMVVLTTPDGKQEELGRLGSFDASSISTDQGTYSIKIDDLKSGGESAANIHFRDQRTQTMRIWVRLAATLLPALMLVLALYIQRKKFFIDEDFYDQYDGSHQQPQAGRGFHGVAPMRLETGNAPNGLRRVSASSGKWKGEHRTSKIKRSWTKRRAPRTTHPQPSP
jgi:hypothetical protein